MTLYELDKANEVLHEELLCDDLSEETRQAIQLAITLIEEKVDEMSSECYGCIDKHCENCLYSRRIFE